VAGAPLPPPPIIPLPQPPAEPAFAGARHAPVAFAGAEALPPELEERAAQAAAEPFAPEPTFEIAPLTTSRAEPTPFGEPFAAATLPDPLPALEPKGASEPFAPAGGAPFTSGDAPFEPARLGFGEVDFDEPAPAPPRSPPAAAAPPEEDLEMLFGGPAPAAVTAAATAATAGTGYRVRRRSGRIFGPFDEAQVVDLLAKGELMGNEVVSADGATWSAIGAVPAFREALRKLAADPGSSPAAPARPPPRAPVAAERADAPVPAAGARPARRRLGRLAAVLAGVIVVVAGAVAGARLMGHGALVTKLVRGGDAEEIAPLLAQARAALAKDDLASERAALDAAARAVATGGAVPEAAALHATVVAALEQRHGAPPAALEQARRAADQLELDEKGELPALVARLAVTLAAQPGAATAPHEVALEQALQKRPPDPDLLALLARAALARGDAARAATLYGRLEAAEPAGTRAPHGLGLAAAARGDVAGARAAFGKALARAPDHRASQLELAALAAGGGDAAGARALLDPLLVEEVAQRLGPAERARALSLRAELLARDASGEAEADRALEAAIAADPRLVQARIALARHRLRHGDAAGAVAALEPVTQAAVTPAIAAVRIRALALAGRALDASSLAERALQAAPGDPALLLAKAAALEASGKPDEAAALYEAAAARDPAAFEPRLALGRLALARRDLPRALAEIGLAVEKGPGEPAAHAALGDAEAARGEPARAEAAFRQALAIDGGHAPAEIGLANLALARGDAAGARARLERALAAEPRSVEARVAYGTLLWKARDLAAAERELQAAVDLAPVHAVALARLGAVKLERGEDDAGAVTRLTAAAGEDPRLVEARHWLGRALLAKGETTGAIAQLRRAVELEPANALHHLHLGVALERSGAQQEAVEAYRASAAADPASADAHERLGALFAANGRWADALGAYEKAVAAAPRTSRLRLALGDCQARLGKPEEAAKVFRLVLRSDPTAVAALYKLARAVHEAEGAKAALPWYERAAREEPANPMPHYYLGYLYKERNQRTRAVQEFQRYLALKPEADERRDIEAEIEDLGGRAGR
jgi:Tfp pilus assembly protein PilF